MTVASGPAPNAGSSPRRWKSHGRVMATIVAVEHAPNNASDTAIETSTSPQASHENGKNVDGEDRPDQQAGDQLATNNRSDGNTDREAADHERLGLGADGVGHVHDAGDEERQCYLCLEFALEGADNRRGDHRARQPDQQPGQAVPEAPHAPVRYWLRVPKRHRGRSRRGGPCPRRARRGARREDGAGERALETGLRRRRSRDSTPRGPRRATPPVPGRRREIPLAEKGP